MQGHQSYGPRGGSFIHFVCAGGSLPTLRCNATCPACPARALKQRQARAGISQNTSTPSGAYRSALHWSKLLDPALGGACHGAKANARALSTAASSRTSSPLTRADAITFSRRHPLQIASYRRHSLLHTLQSYFFAHTPRSTSTSRGPFSSHCRGLPRLPCHDPLAGCGRLVLARSDLGACAKPPTQPLRQATPPPLSRCSFSPRS